MHSNPLYKVGMSAQEKILCLLPLPESFFRDSFSKWIDFSRIELMMQDPKASENEICKAVADATIIYAGPGRPQITRKIIESAPMLRFIQMPGVGYDEVDIEAATERRIVVATCKGGNSQAVAEHAIMFMLVLLKRGIYAHEATRRGDWPQFEVTMGRGTWELKGKTLGVLGFGSIGRKVAEIANAFGVQTLYHKRQRLREKEEAFLRVEYVGFRDLLSRSDILSINVPLNSTTQGMIGYEEISKMKDGAIIVNLSRGGVVDERAVVEALKNRKLMGAGFDVFETEPLLSDNFFSDVDNVMLSPHIAGATREAISSLNEVAGKNIALVLQGKTPINKIAP
jgi:phosphoglycerate dehydrogenase-like enzyme